jgi:hypothetical protein
MAYRLVAQLSGGREVGIAIGGGVPSTARVLYAAREWAGSWRRKSPLRQSPAEILRRLRQNEDYLKFEQSGPCGPGLRKNAGRMLEAWVMEALAESGEEPSSAESGHLSLKARRRLDDCLSAMGFSPEDRPAAVEELAAEIARETPYRCRFFRLLAGRVLRRRPIVFLPIVHRRDGGVYGVDIKDAWAMVAGRAGNLQGLSPAGSWKGEAGAFAREFIKGNFS